MLSCLYIIGIRYKRAIFFGLHFIRQMPIIVKDVYCLTNEVLNSRINKLIGLNQKMNGVKRWRN